ncbi:condensation domain-containing protein [Streptomyces netropsis]|uniref:condensation domain-containing protein n=1 Tax=Streptomyces netropsis TaxID=55404 RepID=UPI0030D088FD
MTTVPDAARQEALLRLARQRKRTAAATGRATPTASPAAGPAPLSHAQHRMWLMDRLGQGGALYNVPFATRVRGPLDLDALAEAVTGLVRRHEVLRTRYAHDNGEPYQEVMTAGPVPVRVVDATGGGEGELSVEAARPFDLGAGPLPRVLCVRHAPEDHTVLLTFHHIAVDGGSLDVITRELDARYRAAVEGRDGQGPGGETDAGAPQYADFARRERAEGAATLDTGLTYWAERLAGARPVPLPRVAAPAGSRGEGHVLTTPLTAQTLEGLRAVGRDHRSTLFTVVLAGAFATLLETTGGEDLVIGCASSHRDRAGWRDLVGLCVNTLAIRTDLSGARDFGELLSRVRDDLLEAQGHRHVPFDLVTGRLGAAARDGDGNPLVGVTADVLPKPSGLRLAGTECEPVDIDLGTAKFGLGFYVAEATDRTGPRALVQYDRGRLDEATAQGLLDAFAALLTEVASDPGRPLSRGTADCVDRPVDGLPAAPLGARGEAVTAVFGELLGDDPGPDGDFFFLGGHSLLAVRVAERLRERLRLPLTGLDVLEHRTPRALAALLDERAEQRKLTAAAGSGGARRGPTKAGTVLVTGGTGGVGAFVLRELAARGRPVRALVRPESAHLVAGDGIEVAEGDLADPGSLRDAVAGVDAVIHSACTFTSPEVDVAAMRALLDGWRQGSFVFVSSVDAYGRPPVVDVTEDTPSAEPLTPYGRAKLDCERMLWEAAGTEGRGGATAVRAPLVWGPHPRLRDQLRWGATGALFQAARSGEPVVLPAAGAVPASGDPWSGAPWVHAAALARALVTCAERPAHGMVNAIGGHVGWEEFATELNRLLGSSGGIRPAAATASAPLLHRHRYRAEALAEELVERPGEDWRSVIAAMLDR